jgi:formate hydrogenlyase subunit 4
MYRKETSSCSFPRRGRIDTDKEIAMLWAFVVLLLIMWGLGLVTSMTMGGLVHLLLVVAVILTLARVIQGRRVL